MLNFLFFFSFSALIIGSLPLWIRAFMGMRATGTFMATRPNAGSPLGFLDVIVMFFFWLVGQAVSIGLVALIFGVQLEELAGSPGDTLSWAMILMASGQLLATLLAVGIFLVRYRKLSVIGWQPDNLGRDLRIGLIAFAMVVPTILFLQWLLVLAFPYEHPTMELLAKNATGLTLLATWFSAVIAAPICEEIFFRGVLQAWLQRLGRGATDHVLTGGWDRQRSADAAAISKPMANASGARSRAGNISKNPYQSPKSPALDWVITDSADRSWTSDAVWPILITSALFALAHAGQGPAPIPLFVFGIALGYLFRRTGSIVPCIVLHMMLNAFSMFWFTLQVFFGEPKTAAILETVRGVTGFF